MKSKKKLTIWAQEKKTASVAVRYYNYKGSDAKNLGVGKIIDS